MREGISSAENKHLARRIYAELVNQGSLRWQRSWSGSCDPPWSEQDVGDTWVFFMVQVSTDRYTCSSDDDEFSLFHLESEHPPRADNEF